MAKCSSPAVPVSMLVLMKWISRLNLAAQAPGPIMRELRLNQLWLIVGRGCCVEFFSYLPLNGKQFTLSLRPPPTHLSAWSGCPHVFFICVYVCACVHVQLSEHAVTVATHVCHVKEERIEHLFLSPSLVQLSSFTEHLPANKKRSSTGKHT